MAWGVLQGCVVTSLEKVVEKNLDPQKGFLRRFEMTLFPMRHCMCTIGVVLFVFRFFVLLFESWVQRYCNGLPIS